MKQIQNAATFQNCQEFCCTNKIVPKFLHHPNVNKNVSNDFENITQMNYLNLDIALGGRNPFRACFPTDTQISSVQCTPISSKIIYKNVYEIWIQAGTENYNFLASQTKKLEKQPTVCCLQPTVHPVHTLKDQKYIK